MKERIGQPVPARDFNLRLTLESGQIFHTMQDEGWWQVLVGKHLLEVQQNNGPLLLACGDTRVAEEYFALDHPMRKIYASFPPDPYSTEALNSCRGMRILRQPAWECLATFITSSMKQVAHIRAMSLALRQRHGEKVGGSLVNAYPAPGRIAGLCEDDLRACGLGYRAKNLLATARRVADGTIDLDALRTATTPDLRTQLMTLPGVGRKVANCVILFAYGRLEAVPVDVWIARIALAMRRRKGTPLALEEFASRTFGPHAGYVQQYLFHHARTTGKLPTR